MAIFICLDCGETAEFTSSNDIPNLDGIYFWHHHKKLLSTLCTEVRTQKSRYQSLYLFNVIQKRTRKVGYVFKPGEKIKPGEDPPLTGGLEHQWMREYLERH